MRKTTAAVAVCCLLVCACFQAYCIAGSISGRVLDSASGKGVRRITVRAFAQGRSVAVEASTENDGSYNFSDLPAGAYSVCIAAGQSYRPASVGPIEIGAEGTALLNLNVRSSIVIDGDSWVQSYPSFSQSFRATGLGVTSVKIRAFGPGCRVKVQVIEGDGPGGKPTGPSRITAKVGHEGSTVVGWSGAEVPTVPGEIYTVVMSAVGAEKWTPGIAGRGDVYPFGCAWFGDSKRPFSDLGITICEDNDGARINYSVLSNKRMHRARSAGQTFTALSRSITFASAKLAPVSGSPAYVRFSIHEGKDNRQIGPSKAVAPGANCAVAWSADEVPVTPGKQYYLHIESYSGGYFLIGYSDDCYAGGNSIFNGVGADDKDITAIIAGRTSDENFLQLVEHDNSTGGVELSNASFENGFEGWSRDAESGSVAGCDGGVVPMWGGRMFGWTNRKTGENSRTVIYRQVKVKKGNRYSFGGSVYTDHTGGRSSDVKIRLVALPEGGDGVRDGEKITTSQWYATEGQWRQGTVEFVAQSDIVTVGFDLEQRFSLDSSSLYVDGAHMECIGE